MPRVDAVSEAGSRLWRLAESGGTADHRPSEAGHPGNPGLDREEPTIWRILVVTMIRQGSGGWHLSMAPLALGTKPPTAGRCETADRERGHDG